MTSRESQTKLKKKSSRFYIIVAAILVLTIILGTIIYELANVSKANFGPGPIEVEVTADKPVYLQGEEVNFTINVNNKQNWPVVCPDYEEFTIEKDDNDIYSTGLNIDFVPNSIPTFPANTRTLYKEWNWNQKTSINKTLVQVQPGNYTLTVFLNGLKYGGGNSGNCTFEIR